MQHISQNLLWSSQKEVKFFLWISVAFLLTMFLMILIIFYLLFSNELSPLLNYKHPGGRIHIWFTFCFVLFYFTQHLIEYFEWSINIFERRDLNMFIKIRSTIKISRWYIRDSRQKQRRVAIILIIFGIHPLISIFTE